MQPIMNKRAALAAVLGVAALPMATKVLAAEPAVPPDLWAAMLDRLKGLGDRLGLDLSDAERRERFYEHNLQMLAYAWFHVMAAQGRPYFVPIQNYMLTTASPNPDTLYANAHVEPGGVYRLSGYRGTVEVVDIQWSAAFAGVNTLAPRLGGFSFEEVEVGPDGRFEIILGGARPPSVANWWPLDPTVRQITVRSIAKDWTKQDPRLALQRLDAPTAIPATPEPLAARSR